MKNLTLFVMLTLALCSCREDIIETGEDIVTQDPPVIIEDYNPISELVSGSIFGKVYDEFENPIADAKVTYDGEVYTTNEFGIFIIQDRVLDRQGTFCTVEKSGYFKGSRRFYPRENSINYVNIQLLETTDIGAFNAQEGGKVVSPDGIEILFQENSIKSLDANLYTGQVYVAAKWLNPTAPNIGQIMPGDLIGLNSKIEEVSLVSYGMMAVELLGEDGESLNIADGNTAKLSFPIPEELRDNAPLEIPLWSFEDEQYGIWIEESVASLQNNMYVGDVSHFSFWNCNAPFPLVQIEGRLNTESGIPLANAVAIIRGEGFANYAITDNDGYFAAKIKKGVELHLSVSSSSFDDCLFSDINLGSFDVDTNIDEIELQDSGDLFTVTGTAVDCDNNPITNGVVIIEFSNRRHEYFLSNGNIFTLPFKNCNNDTDVAITVINIDNFNQSDPISATIQPLIDFGPISACDDETQFLITVLNGDSMAWLNPNSLFAFYEDGNNVNMQDLFECFFYDVELKTYDLNDSDISFLRFSAQNSNILYFVNEEDIKSMEITVTSTGVVGDVFSATFTGIGDATGGGGCSGCIIEDAVFSGEFRYILREF